MSTNKISITLLSVLLGSTLIQTSLQQSAIWCKSLPAGTDPSDVACPAIYDPVCAYMKSVPLGVTVGNECVACDQEGYDYYYPGECQGVSQEEEEVEEVEEEEGNSQEESSEGCVDNEEGNNQEEEEEEEEEGASQEEEEEEGSNQEEEEEGDSQEEEEENDDKKYKCVRSNNPGDVVCGLIYQPVCAYNYGDDEGTTVGNRCTACEQQDYDYYTNGECENQEEEEEEEEEGDSQEEEEENDEEEGENQEEEEEEEGDNQEEEEEEEEENDDKKYKCVRSSNPGEVVCGLIYQPVCAYNYGDDEGTTVGNRCTACEQQDYDYYSNGAC